MVTRGCFTLFRGDKKGDNQMNKSSLDSESVKGEYIKEGGMEEGIFAQIQASLLFFIQKLPRDAQKSLLGELH